MSSHRMLAASPARLASVLIVIAGTSSAIAAPESVSASEPRRAEIRWSNGLVDATRPLGRATVVQRLGDLAQRPDARRVVVTLAEPPTPASRDDLANAGVVLLGSLGGTSYFASLGRMVDAEAAAAAGVDFVDQIDPTRKLHADLAGGIVRAWTIVTPTPEKLKAQIESGAVTQQELRSAQADPSVAVLVAFHHDALAGVQGERLARSVGGEIRRVIRSVNTVVMHLPASRIAELALDDAVMWVEPPLPALTELNAENRVLTGVNTVNASPYGLDGSGVTALIFDGGRAFAHGDFAGRLTIGPSDTAGISDHATHVTGTVGGSGAGNANNRGMAPGVQLVSYGFEQAGGLSQGFLYTDPGDIESDYTEAISMFGADLANNSIGTNTEPNGYPCEWQGNYGITSALIDEIARGSLGNPFRIVWANGNERQGSRCDVEGFGDFFSTAPPAGAKNHITVGSVDSDTDLTSSFSSWGPVDDGRIKPDISAPGCQAGGDGGVTSTNSFGATSYGVKCGTSMASPTVTGISALLLEQYRLSFPDRDDMRNCTLKALLANTAVDRGNPGPDYQYGYGSVRAVPAVDTIIAENVIEGDVGQGEVYAFVVILSPGDNQLRVTVAWDDPSGTPNVSPALVNDLDVRVIAPGGAVALPWTLNPSNPSANAVRTVRDGVNNIEQVQIDNAAPGAYLVEVRGFNIAQGPRQIFGAASNGFLVNCSSAGRVGVGSPAVPCEGSVEVSVIDCDLNTSDSTVDLAAIHISSDSDPTGKTIILTESAPASSKFASSFTFSESGRADLLVHDGDLIRVVYTDQDDGQGGTNVLAEQTIRVDCAPPQIVAATVDEIAPRSAEVTVQTDEPASVTVRYGTALNSLTGTATSPALLEMHEIQLTGLTDGQGYVFVVDATDGAGNAGTDTNGGAGYAFTTPEVPDFFTEAFTSGIGLNNKRIMFTPSAGFEQYTACLEDLNGAFFTDPTGGTIVSLSDDSYATVNIGSGQQVTIYGQDYSQFFIGSNGYLTFTAGDTDYSEELVDHFDTPRVSAVFDDLNPSTGGNVRWKQLADRMAVTWSGVPQYSNSDSNTFQIELFFDGRIAISHLSVSTGDAIVGLSAGAGLDPDFIESAMASYPVCGACGVDFAEPIGELNFFDIAAYITLFNANDPQADFAAPLGVFNFFDVSAFIAEFNAGCP